MLYTSNEVKKKIDALNVELQSLKTLEEQSSTYVLGINEKAEDVAPEFNYVDTYNRIFDVIREISRLKYAISKFNLETILPCGLSIAEALVLLPNLNVELKVLEYEKSKLPKTRVNSYASNGNVEYKLLNYELNEAITLYGAVSEKINNIKLQLDEANNTLRTIELE